MAEGNQGGQEEELSSTSIDIEKVQNDPDSLWDGENKLEGVAETNYRKHIKNASLVAPREESTTPIIDLTQQNIEANREKTGI